MPARSPPKNSTPSPTRRVPAGRPTARRRAVVAAVRPGPVGDVVGRVAVGEAVREDLVEDPVGQPARRVVAGEQHEVVAIGGRRRVEAGAVEPAWPGRGQDEEAVAGRGHRQDELDLPPASGRSGVRLGQLGRRPARRRASCAAKIRSTGASWPARTRSRSRSPMRSRVRVDARRRARRSAPSRRGGATRAGPDGRPVGRPSAVRAGLEGRRVATIAAFARTSGRARSGPSARPESSHTKRRVRCVGPAEHAVEVEARRRPTERRLVGRDRRRSRRAIALEPAACAGPRPAARASIDVRRTTRPRRRPRTRPAVAAWSRWTSTRRSRAR